MESRRAGYVSLAAQRHYVNSHPLISGGFDAQVTHQAGQGLLVGVVLLPVAKIPDVAVIAQLDRPRLVGREHRSIATPESIRQVTPHHRQRRGKVGSGRFAAITAP
jgi:hypothetical protein